ncbi:MAG: radical SAM family heme chaperone HemW [Muribaculaceae bacterium]|nr:radical SAM family heme chaperone HemW [Muribaculaceae bacterium]
MSDSIDIQYIPEEGGLYIHVAYCRKKCLYCDFFSAGGRIADWKRYVDALINEFITRKDEMAWPLRTVYFGGGTPSLMPGEEFIRLCDALAPYFTEVVEFTLEVNPDDVNDVMLELWKNAGVNRLSIGIQTFDDKSLASIGRSHDHKTALRAYQLARKVFDNISIDLMFGLPGQTLDSWRNDVETALRLRPEHISCYALMYEDGTALTTLRNQGRIKEAAEKLSEEMFLLLIKKLADNGYDHYEISNFALPGHRSIHNSSYWLQKPYIGLGPSAHSYDGKHERKSNRADLRGYIDYWSDDLIISHRGEIIEKETLSDEELIEEYILTRMRMREGIPIHEFRSRFNDTMLEKLIKKCRFLSKQGLISITENHISLNEKAILLSDSVIVELASIC